MASIPVVARHAASKRPDIVLKARTFRPPSTLQRARFMHWLTSTLLADDAGAAVPGLEARVAPAAPVPAEELRAQEPRSPFSSSPCREDNVLPTLSTPCVAQGGAVIPVGRDRTLGNLAEMCMREVDCLLVGLPEKRPVVGRGVGDQRRAALSGHGRPWRRAAPSSFRFSAKNSMFSSECRPRHGSLLRGSCKVFTPLLRIGGPMQSLLVRYPG